MEFKFGAVDDQPQMCNSFSSNPNSLPNQPLQATYPNAYFRAQVDPTRNQNYIREAIRWEHEKEKIREEIIVGEIVRRRILEDEVRRELMLEQQMAMRRTSEAGISFEDGLIMQCDTRFQLMNRFSHTSSEKRLPCPGQRTLDIPQLPQLPDAISSNSRPRSEVNKDRVIILAKPDPNLCGAKRKAVSSSALGPIEIPPFNSRKKLKEEWSCAICQVSATTEKNFSQHLKGRKHMVKETKLRADNAHKNSCNAPHPKKAGKAPKPMETIGTSNAEQGAERLGELCSRTADLDDEVLKQKKRGPKDSKKVITPKTGQKAGSKNKNKYKLWCEICEVGVYSLGALEAHRLGKKHMSLVSKLGKIDAEPAATPITPPAATASHNASWDKDM